MCGQSGCDKGFPVFILASKFTSIRSLTMYLCTLNLLFDFIKGCFEKTQVKGMIQDILFFVSVGIVPTW